jgi:SAM-dependent methyltransferase
VKVVLNGLGSYEELRQHIVANGCYSERENERIYNKWFAAGPRYLFRAVDRKYHLTEGTFCNSNSYGIEIEEYETKFAASIGLTVHNMDVITSDFSHLPQVDCVWNSATLEHVESPHIFLRKLHVLLKPQGLLALYVPTIPALPFLRSLPRLGKHLTGYLHSDHINAFTPSTLRFFCERAGFETVEVSSFYPRILSPFNRLNLTDGCVYIGLKTAGWEYPRNSTRRASTNEKGFEFIGQKFGEQPSEE